MLGDSKNNPNFHNKITLIYPQKDICPAKKHIIQYLIHKLEIEYKYFNFIEFGVENYLESNTRFLLLSSGVP